MTRKISEKSYQYIQGWLKTKYATDPEFREKMLINNRLQNERVKARRMISITLLEIEATRIRNF
jgi:flagellum-specific peptidoglycan hydrolase FlgJ